MSYRIAGKLLVLFGWFVLCSSACTRADTTSTLFPSAPPSAQHPTSLRIAGYFSAQNAHASDYQVRDIPADHLTHINYAFAALSEEGTCVPGDPTLDTDQFFPETDSWNDPPGTLRGNFNQLRHLKAQHAHLKTLISVGGWDGSTHFSDVALTAASREQFARLCVGFMRRYGFDGIDIDWEYPVVGGHPDTVARAQDRENVILLLAELRRQLDKQAATDGQNYLLTIAAPAGPQVYQHLDLAQMHPLLDWINLMTYDFHGAWDETTNFHAPLYATSSDPSADPLVQSSFNVHAAVQGYIQAGVPPHKMLVGIPFYGPAWQGVAATNNGLYQPAAGPALIGQQRGVVFSRDIQHIRHTSGYTRFWHAEAQVPWLYNEQRGVMISYEDAQSIRHKAAYIRAQRLGGAMIWELSGDDSDSPKSLLAPLATHLYESAETSEGGEP
jgi:chitinase